MDMDVDMDMDGTVDIEKIVDAKNEFSRFAGKPFRDHQEEAVRRIVGARKRFCVIEAPTGSGKSLLGMVAGKMVGTTTYLVHSRMLQTQLKNDFPEVPILWGRGNYKCIAFRDESVMCDSCMHSKMSPCYHKRECLYELAKAEALGSKIRVLNYSYFLAEANYVGKFGHNDLVIVDEGDSLEDTLVDNIKIEMSFKMIERLKIGFPVFKTALAKNGVSSWRVWAGSAKEKLQYMLQGLHKYIKSYGYDKLDESTIRAMKQINRVNAMLGKLDVFIRHVDESWIYEQKEEYGQKIVFRPVWLTESIVDEFMWRHGDRFALMSATFHKPLILAKLLGMPLGEIEFHSFPSTFPEESREIKVNPVANLTYKTMDAETPKLLKEIRRILDMHPNEKGLIHCVSYSLAGKIMSIGNGRMITHNGEDKIDVVRRFKESSKPLVMVSPSMERGISLDDDYCRFIIWAKAPYLSLNDKLVSARIYGTKGVGQSWYVSHMLLSVVQGCGRGTRNREDWCRSYILDDQIAGVMKRHPDLMPGWFMEACW